MWTLQFQRVVAVDPRPDPAVWVAIGTGLGADTVVPWQRVGRVAQWVYNGTLAGLADGGVYWSMVQMESGVRSVARTLLDTSPPAVLHRRLAVEAPRPSNEFLTDFTATLCWRGMFADPHSGVEVYDVTLLLALETLASYRRLTEQCVNVTHGLPSAARLTVNVTAFNRLGLSAVVATNLTVDLSPPVPPDTFSYTDHGARGTSIVAQVCSSSIGPLLPQMCWRDACTLVSPCSMYICMLMNGICKRSVLYLYAHV